MSGLHSFRRYFSLSLLPSRPLLPPATTHLRLPPSLGSTLRHIPPALGLWCPAASPASWGTWGPPRGSCSCLSFSLWVVSWGLLYLPPEPLGPAPGRAESRVERENQTAGLGWEEIDLGSISVHPVPQPSLSLSLPHLCALRVLRVFVVPFPWGFLFLAGS